MKNNIWKVFVVCSLAGIVICMIQIRGLNQEIHNLNNQLNQRISTLENSFWQSSSHIEELIKQEASILAKADWEYGAFQNDDLTVDVLCTITPKEYDPAKTTACIVYENTEISMVYENGAYTAVVPVSVFEETPITKVLFYEGDYIRAEGLDWNITPLYEYLPSIDAYLHGSEMNFQNKGKTIWQSSDSLQVFFDTKGEEFAVKSITLVRYLDGMETDRVELPLKDNMIDYLAEIDLKYEIPNGSTQEIYVDVVDSLGLRYRTCIDHTVIAEDGGRTEGMSPYNEEKIIYDQNNKEVYRGFW